MTKDLNPVLLWGPKLPGNWAFEADIQHTTKRSSNWHAKHDSCETSGKFLQKLLKTGMYTYFVVQSGPKIWPILSTHSKVLAMSMWSNIGVKPVKTFWENFDWILTYLGAQNGPKIGPQRPIFHTPLKVLAMSMWSNTDVKPVNTYWESDQSPEFWLTLGSNMTEKLGFWGPYCTHLWK